MRKLLLLVILFFTIGKNNAQEIKDIISPINAYAGIEDSLVIDDLFYHPTYNIKIIPGKNIEARIDLNKHLLYIKPTSSFSGLDLLKFECDNKTYSVIVISRLKYPYTFKFKPEKTPKHISVFGNFNSWNRNDLYLKEGKDGYYYYTYNFDPGRYEYKFYVDGEEFLDQINKDSIANGIGGFNSSLIIRDKQDNNSYLYIGNKKSDEDYLELCFNYDKGELKEDITEKNIIALLDNYEITNGITVNGNKVTVKLNKEDLKSEKRLRIIVNNNNKLSNMQTVLLYNGDVRNLNSPFNWYDGIIYSLLTDRFNNGDKKNDNPIIRDSLFYPANYQGGDFRGIINKIKEGYFTKLGINTIWISPVYDNPNVPYREYPAPHRWYSGYHGYWPISDTRVEEHFGTMDELKELVKTAHESGIKILLDFVSNHTHIDHDNFKNHPEWYGKLELPDGRLNLRFWDEYRLTTWFEPYLPSYDYLGSKEALEHVSSNAIWWLKETGADGFRHDAVKHVPNEFWRELTKKLKTQIEPERGIMTYQIGETFGSYGLISSYVNNGQLSSQFNFNLFDTTIPVFIDPKVSFSVLASELKQTERVYGNPHYMGNIMDSHDKVRFMSYADKDIIPGGENLGAEMAWSNPPVVNNPESYKYPALYYAFMNTIPGIPVIYYGSEWGMTGASDPDNRRMMKFEDSLDRYQLELLETTRKIINIRKNSTALKYGDLIPVLVEHDVFAYLRTDFNEKYLVVLNKSESNKEITVSIPHYLNIIAGNDLISNVSYKIINNTINLNLSKKGFAILKLN
jgi:glycosidase